MSGSRNRKSRGRGWRWATVGLKFGAAATLGLGCRSTDPAPAGPVVPRVIALYPGIPSPGPATEPAPVQLAAAAVPADPTADPAPAGLYTAICPGLRPAGPVPYSMAAAAAAAGQPQSAARPAAPVSGAPGPAAEPLSRVRPAAATAPPDGTPDPPAEPAVCPPSGEVGGDLLDLGIALRLAGVDNPTINLARERINEALALQLGAQVLALPTVNIGGNYHYHSGPLQASYGQIRYLTEQSLYLGFGAGTVGSGVVAFPGLRLFAPLADAVYEPLAARQRVTARQFDSRATQNTILLDVSAAYLNLVGAESRLDILRRGVIEGRELVRLTAVYAKAGQGRQGDANRAAAFEGLVRRQVRQGEEDVAVASAQLCRLLNLDPSAKLRTPAGTVDRFRLVPEDADLEALVTAAIQARPELVARRATVVEAQIRVRQEKVRPFVPTITAGLSGGLFGGGGSLVAYQSSPLTARTDIDVMAVWNIQNLGLGNVAQVRRTTAVVGEASAEYDSAVNLVRRQVVEAVADTRAAGRQVEIARTALGTSAEGFRLEMERIRDSLGRPIELLDSFRQLLEARQAFVAAVVAYDITQFRLFVALGSNPLTGPDVAKAVPAAQPTPGGGPLPAPSPGGPTPLLPRPDGPVPDPGGPPAAEPALVAPGKP